MGIGKKLITQFEKQALKQGSNKIKIKSSLYAVNFYQNRGYKKSTGIKTAFKGLNFQPMKKEF